MNTMQAFAKAQAAEANGDKIKYYDYQKALKLAKKAGVKKVEFYMAGDREWTGDKLTLSQIKRKEEVAGINGSIWATPMISINGEDMECWTYKL